MSRNWMWEGPVFGADRLPDEGDANHSGVYALKGRPRTHGDLTWSPHCCVVGWVALSGRVLEHEFGYRAERVVIRRLRLVIGTHLRVVKDDDLRWIQNQLEQRYQAPVKLGEVERRIAHRRRSKSSLVGGSMSIDIVWPDKTWRKK
jgi:hypothetical protein